MSYSISGSGHNVQVEKLVDAFTALVDALDEATEDDKDLFQGSVSGQETDDEGNTQPISITAQLVRQSRNDPAFQDKPGTRGE